MTELSIGFWNAWVQFIIVWDSGDGVMCAFYARLIMRSLGLTVSIYVGEPGNGVIDVGL